MMSSEYTAVRHILTAPILATRCAPYIGDEDFAWDGLLSEVASMSGGEATLVKVAHDLWTNTQAVAVWELPRRLGPTSFHRVLEALTLYRGESPFDRIPVAA